MKPSLLLPVLTTLLVAGALLLTRDGEELPIEDAGGKPIHLLTTNAVDVYDIPSPKPGDLLRHKVSSLGKNSDVLLLATSADGLYKKIAFYGDREGPPQIEGWVPTAALRLA